MRRYDSPQSFLKFLYEQKRAKNPRYSLRAWARRTHVSASTISRIFSGERRITYEFAVKMAEKMELTEFERTMLMLLALRENAPGPFEANYFNSLVHKTLQKRK